MRALSVVGLLLPLLGAQEPGGAAPTAAQLPELGAPAALPDGAPAQLATVTRQLLQKHAYWLADDARKGRFTGSASQQATAEYVAEQFAALGLQPLGDKKTFFQWYPLEQLVLHGSSGIEVGGQTITDLGVLPAGDTKKLSASGKLTWCGAALEDDLPGTLKGKVPVVLLSRNPRGLGPVADMGAMQRYNDIARRLSKLDAKVGVVVVAGDASKYGDSLNYHAVMPDHPLHAFGSDKSHFKPLQLPLVIVSQQSAAPLLDALGVKFADGEVIAPTEPSKVNAKVTLRLDTQKKGRACNVVAVLEGTSRKHEALVFSAHHDHIGRRVDGDSFNGADDNASGTSGLLTIAEAFAKGERPTRSVVFLSVSGEELGLWGSAWFADNPTWPLDRIVADVNIDMIGRAVKTAEGCSIQITPSKDHDKYSSLGRAAAQLAPKFGVSFTSGDQYYARSDHYNFAKKGVPVVFLCDGEHPDYHKVTDSADRLDYVSMEAVARLAFWTGWQVADGKDKPQELGKQSDW
ncbi:MAG: M28 family peptidase [Planctomycetota bacterium]